MQLRSPHRGIETSRTPGFRIRQTRSELDRIYSFTFSISLNLKLRIFMGYKLSHDENGVRADASFISNPLFPMSSDLTILVSPEFLHSGIFPKTLKLVYVIRSTTSFQFGLPKARRNIRKYSPMVSREFLSKLYKLAELILVRNSTNNANAIRAIYRLAL